MRFYLSLALLLALFALPVVAEESTEETAETTVTMEQKLIELELKVLEMQQAHARQLKELSSQIAELKRQLEATKQKSAAATPRSAQPATPTLPQATTGVQGTSSQTYFNPKISVIPDMVGVYGSQGDQDTDTMTLREVEIGFSGNVDTWGRFDMTTTFHNEIEFDFGEGDGHGHEHEEGEEGHGGGFEVEEAYFTYLNLPQSLQARFGKFRTAVGKTNEFHPHSLPWTEYPLPVRSYLGEEGLIGTGASLSWLAPTEFYSELTYQVFLPNPEHAAGVADEGIEDYSHLLNLTTFFDLNDSLTMELGGTSLVAPERDLPGIDDSWLNAFDITFKWMPSGDGSFRRLEWRTEVFGLRKTLEHHEEEEHHEDEHDDHHEEEHAEDDSEHHDEDEHEEEHMASYEREDMFGVYSSIAYRLNRWWEFGGRFDYAEGPFDIHQEETEYSIFLTWWQSEYAYWRLNFIRNELTLDEFEADPLHKIYLQFNFSLGPHPAHKY